MTAPATGLEVLKARLPRFTGDVPTSAFLHLSDSCNHSCTHCYQVLGERGELPTREVLGLLDELAAAGVLFLTLSGGEVTLREDLFEILAHARRLRFAVTIFTNGYRVDEAMARRFADEAVLEVEVSLYSADARVHDSITQVPGSWERTMAGVRALRAAGLTVTLKTPLMSVNAASYPAFEALAESLGCHHRLDHTITVREDGDRRPIALRVDEATLLAYARDEALALAPRGTTPKQKSLDEATCGACATINVTPDGTIRPCTLLPFSLGNIKDTTLAEAYRHSETARFVQALRWRDLPACRVCSLRDYCLRCHANALLEDGDLFGPTEAACRWAKIRYHATRGTSPEGDEPRVGPYAVTDAGRLAEREWVRGVSRVPVGVSPALVVGKDGPRGSGRARVHLPVLRTLPGTPTR